MRFQIPEGERPFPTAPRLPVRRAEQILGEQAFHRAEAFLPEKVKKKLADRSSVEGHLINSVRYFPHPIVPQDGDPECLQPLLHWGMTYASILSKVARAYRNRVPEAVRFLDRSIIRFLPAHLRGLPESYKTLDDLAGTHAGDDFLAGRSVEWNLGAVGGLDEGYRTALELEKIRTRKAASDSGTHFVEKDPLPAIRSALHWAYESFAAANSLEPLKTPAIGFLEHDDLYGSTVSVCERLRECGEKAELCFHHELACENGRLVTSTNRPLDLVYMDFHFEDLLEGHPLLEAVRENRVALECSPFAHLVLRSKALCALLCMPSFQRAVQLNAEEIESIKTNLMPTYLWRQKAFDGFGTLCGDALSTLEAQCGLKKFFKGTHTASPIDNTGISVKSTVGVTYGGTGVANILEENGYDARDAGRLVRDTVSRISSTSTTLQGKVVLANAKNRLKPVLNELVLETIKETLKDLLWEDLLRAWGLEIEKAGLEKRPLEPRNLMALVHQAGSGHPLPPLQEVFEKDPSLATRLEKVVQRLTAAIRNGKMEKEALETGLRKTLDLLAGAVFRDSFFQERYRHTLRDLHAHISLKESTTLPELLAGITSALNIFVTGTLGRPMPKSRGSLLEEALQEPYRAFQLRAVNPLVLQPFRPPEALGGFNGLHVSTRTHILFTRGSPSLFFSGAQLFYLKGGKPDNRTKMTGSFWVQSD